MIVNSLGLLGQEKVVPLLERLLSKNDWPTLNFTIAQSLYLLTGRQYEFINQKGNKEKLYLSAELTQVREVILATNGKIRKFKDMLILDKLFRPPVP